MATRRTIPVTLTPERAEQIARMLTDYASTSGSYASRTKNAATADHARRSAVDARTIAQDIYRAMYQWDAPAPPTVQVTFHNVEITIEASDAREAYAYLCDMFDRSRSPLEYSTDSYSVHPDPSRRRRRTAHLSPDVVGCDECGEIIDHPDPATSYDHAETCSTCSLHEPTGHTPVMRSPGI